MPIVSIENEWNSTLRLTQSEDKWQLFGMTGLNPPAADIVTSVIPHRDGAMYQTSRLQMRNVVLSLAIVGNVERNRMALNSVIMANRRLRVYYKNGTLDVYIDGYVETFEYDVFSDIVTAQISVLCPAPYWVAREKKTVDLSAVISLFEFPFSTPAEGIAISELKPQVTGKLESTGGVQTGVKITMTCVRPVLAPSIMNLTTGETMTFSGLMLTPDQTMEISTEQGDKYIHIRSGSEVVNAINMLDMDSRWITITPGVNDLIVNAGSGLDGLTVQVELAEKYGGV